VRLARWFRRRAETVFHFAVFIRSAPSVEKSTMAGRHRQRARYPGVAFDRAMKTKDLRWLVETLLTRHALEAQY
jgi:hypothetical protein